MTIIYEESEHQELFYPDADLRQPIPIHIPSALGKLGYYVCLRLPQPTAAKVGDVRIFLKVGGLRPDDVVLNRGENIVCRDLFPSKEPGEVWLVLCRAFVSRGDGVLRIEGLPNEISQAPLLLCTWPRFLESGQADDWLRCRRDPFFAIGGVPLGGIGCGKVELCRDGRFRNFSGNNNQDMPFEEPDGLAGAFLAIASEGENRLLATRPASGIQPVPRLEAEIFFPQILLRAPDCLPGLTAEVCASAPWVPHNLEISCLPGFLVQWKIRNFSNRRRQAICRLAWPNLVGAGGGIRAAEKRTGYGDGSYCFWPAPEAGNAQVLRVGDITALRYDNAPNPVSPAADGHHYVAARGSGCGVNADRWFGSVYCAVDLPPGEEAQCDMAVVWEMPHWVDSQGIDRGLYWQNFYADGLQILNRLFCDFTYILREAGALARLLAQADLPLWLKERLCNCNYPLIANSVLFRDGRFSINEGPTEMSGCYGTIDQRLAAHPATQFFFPALNRMELALFARTQTANGEINHDLGSGHLERGPSGQRWPDIQCSFVIQCARHARQAGDLDFSREMWPKVRAALVRHAQWAEEGKGVAQLGHRTGLGTSYDSYHYEGTTAYIGTLWIAACQIVRIWAEEVGDTELLRLIPAWIEAARRRMEDDLWNGVYYRAFAGAGCPSNENSHAGTLAGVWYSRMLAGEDILPPARLRDLCKALMARHGSERFAVPPDEVTPDGASGSDFGWLPYIEAFLLAPAAILRHHAVFEIWERIAHAMSGNGKHPCDTRLMYRPLTGEPSWGAYYMTAPASWLVYEAMLDFTYTPADGALRFNPSRSGKFPVIHPLFWAMAEAKGEERILRIVRLFSEQPLAVRCLEAPAGASVAINDGEPVVRLGRRGAYERWGVKDILLATDVVLSYAISAKKA